MSKDLIGYFSCDPETGAPVWDEGCVCGDNIFSVEGTGTVGRPIKFADAPVAAQPDITQQTLNDVMAGIPARDAEIEALRKEIEVLQAQLVDRPPEMQGKPVDESPILQGQQQPASDADDATERALAELVDKIMPGLDTGDLLADAATASKTLDSAKQDADKVDAALAEMVHAMFRSANSIPVTRITIDRKQYEATIDAARKEQA